ncbi:MAG: HEAT repeat domain-containing protein [Candidatus Helarchaeota archaeon]
MSEFIKIAERRWIDKEQHHFIYEKSYTPEQDEVLKRQGVDVCAVTEVRGREIHNRIEFRKGSSVAVVPCLHIAVLQVIHNPDSESGFEEVSTEEHPDLQQLLSPEDHHFALRSMVQCLIERGIQDTMLESFRRERETGKEPLDFNHLMRMQIVKALMEIAPDETKEMALFLLEYVTSGNLERVKTFDEDFHYVFLSPKFDFADLKRLDKICGGIRELNDDLKLDLLGKRKLPLWALEKLAGDEDLWIRTEIARRKHLPESLVVELAGDKDLWIRCEIARREDLPESLVVKLAGDEAWEVRCEIAWRDDLPKPLVAKFAGDEDQMVRRWIASRRDLPEPLVVKLAGDENPEVRSKIARREDLPEPLVVKLVGDENPEVRSKIARREDLPEPLVVKLAGDEDPEVRSKIARRKHLPESLVVKLAGDEDPEVRRAIAGRRDLPEVLVKMLANDEDGDVQSEIELKHDR